MNRNLSRALGVAVLSAALATTVVPLAGATPTAADPEPRFRVVEAPPAQTDERADEQSGPELAASAGPDDPKLGPNRRQITSKVVSRQGSLYLRGDVESYAGRRVVVVKRSCSSCRWRVHDVAWTGKRGIFRSRIYAPQQGSTYYRAKVDASNGYARSYSSTWETYY